VTDVLGNGRSAVGKYNRQGCGLGTYEDLANRLGGYHVTATVGPRAGAFSNIRLKQYGPETRSAWIWSRSERFRSSWIPCVIPITIWKDALIIPGIHDDCLANLPQVRLAFNGIGSFAGATQGGEQNRNQQGDYANDDEKLDEGKSDAPEPGSGV
jgi:hypothetical protein